MDNIKNIIESLLFASDEPLTLDSLKQIITDAGSQELRGLLEELKADYDERQGGFYLRILLFRHNDGGNLWHLGMKKLLENFYGFWRDV